MKLILKTILNRAVEKAYVGKYISAQDFVADELVGKEILSVYLYVNEYESMVVVLEIQGNLRLSLKKNEELTVHSKPKKARQPEGENILK